MTERKQTRLDRHREEFQKSNKTMKLLTAAELSEEEKLIITDEVFAYVRKFPGIEYSEAYSNVLYSFGVMCPHPNNTIGTKWFNCKMCGCLVMNSDAKAS